MPENHAQNDWIVLKFGGTSVADLDKWIVIESIIKERVSAGQQVLVVHSALSGISNRLQALADQPETKLLQEICQSHKNLCHEMGLPATLLETRFETLTCLSERRRKDSNDAFLEAEIMAQGELMATTISAAHLNQRGMQTRWLDARKLLQTSTQDRRNSRSRVLSGRCEIEFDSSLRAALSEETGICITQGFIAADNEGRTVLLGRGGSDTSAAYFAAKIQASRLEIWTDVPGLFSANPRMVSTARQLRFLDYDEAQEIASSGGKVLHPRSIGPVARHGIPMHIYALTEPDSGGTTIGQPETPHTPQVKAISVLKGIILVSMDSVRMWHQSGFLADTFGIFKSHGVSVDLISTSQTNVTVSLDPNENNLSAKNLRGLKDDLAASCKVQIIRNCGSVTLVGNRIRAILHKIGPAMQLFSEHRIHMLVQSSNDLSLTVVVDEDQTDRLAKNMHRLLIGVGRDETVLGPTWEELMGVAVEPPPRVEAWWRNKRDKLIAQCQQRTPSYVYDPETISKSLDNLLSLQSVSRSFYAMKANPFPGVMRLVHAAGLGFECVSPGEIKHVLALFPDIDRGRILFTPNFAPRQEYEFAYEQNIMVTLDNIHPLAFWPEVFSGRKISVRLDPGHGDGHHKYVRTAGEQSKFGIARSEIDTLKSLAKKHKVKITTLHSHSGSGITNYENWLNTAEYLAALMSQFPDCEALNLGGGLGIQETPSEPALNLELMDAGLAKISKNYGNVSLWLEPGRYVVAQAGALVTRVTQVKLKGSTHYVGVETGMNSLIRPALYGAYHDIVNLTRLDDAADYTATVVGPICETGDILGVDRQLPRCQEGDFLLIANAGAYGAAMASRYNLRDVAEEWMLAD